MIGANTFGHAPHMSLIHAGELHLWIPVAFWLSGDNEPINHQSVTPDEEVTGLTAEQDSDPILTRALQLARERHGQKTAA